MDVSRIADSFLFFDKSERKNLTAAMTNSMTFHVQFCTHFRLIKITASKTARMTRAKITESTITAVLFPPLGVEVSSA